MRHAYKLNTPLWPDKGLIYYSFVYFYVSKLALKLSTEFESVCWASMRTPPLIDKLPSLCALGIIIALAQSCLRVR